MIRLLPSMKTLLCLLSFVAGFGLLAGCQNKPKPKPVPAAKWTAADRWSEYTTEGYVVRNNIWGDGYGPQAIWARDPQTWGVCADHPNTGGIKAYPHVGKMVEKRLSALRKVTSRFGVTVPAEGSYNTAYDIWCEKHAYEIMLWVNWAGKMGPITTHYDDAGQPIPDVANVTVGGHTWNIYKGSNGANEVFSFLRTSPATAGEVDVKAILDWIEARGWFAQGRNVILDEVQFGWEIADSPGGLDFAVTDFAVEVK